MAVTNLDYKACCDAARRRSIEHKCVQHVCHDYVSDTYYVSDWYDGSTVVSFENGRQL
jgi:hypothetical protein